MEDDEPMPSQTAIRRSKRARVQIRANDMREMSLNEDEREESSDDFEESRPRAKRNKATASTSAAAPTTDQTLIEVLKGNRKQIPQVVKSWVGHYEKEPEAAKLELVMLILEACGAKYHIDEESLDQTNVDDVVVALVNMAKRGEVEDYHSSKKKELKNFKDNLIFFWDNLVTECQSGPLFDGDLFDRCTDYIIALSCTPPRVYRQIASLMGLQLVTSFITVAKMLGAQRETTQRQLNAEKKKAADGPRVESLDKRLSVTHEKITVIEEMMRKIFKGLFVHRYRDVESDIRMLCIQSLGIWIQEYPSLFLQDLYLKYLGWTLNDKTEGVRKASVLALQELYKVDDNVPSLGLFTERFYKRMIELADDIDISVAVCGIGLVTQLLRLQLIPDEDLGSLYDLLIDDPPEIRRAIGALVYDHLIDQSSRTGNAKESSKILLSRMLHILKEFSSDEMLIAYVIDAIWDYMDAMKDWKCIISMLLEEDTSIELSDADATNLIRLLSASIKKSVGEKIVPATDNRKQYYSKAQKETFESNKQTITNAMMKNYPQLLRKFMVDRTKVSYLLEIVVHMNLELYSLKSQNQNFTSVLKLMKEAFFKYGEKDVLRSCVRAINYCAAESRGELHDFALNELKKIEDELLVKLKSAVKEVTDGDDEYLLLVNLKRLYELQLSREISIESLYEEFVHILKTFRNIDDEVICFLLLNMHLHLCWCLHSIINCKTVSETVVSSLKSKRSTLFEQLEDFLQTCFENSGEAKCGNVLACRVCTIVAEQWCLFKKANFASTELETLGYLPDNSILQKFWHVCEKQLHMSDETEDDDTNREYVEETNRDAVIIAASKLVAVDAVPKEYLGAEIISHFVSHGSSVSEVIKHLITVLRKKDDKISSILLEALKKAYKRHLVAVSSSDEVASSTTFQECKDLAARLSGMFAGAARNKYRLDVLNIVKGGIEYAFSDVPKHLSFLDAAVLHFISKLPLTDILDILKDVERRTTNVNTDEDPSGWRPYLTFVETIREKYVKNEGFQDEKEGGVSVRRRGRPRKNQNIQGKKLFDEPNSSEEEDSISGSEQDAEEEEEEEAPLIHSFRSASKLKSLSVSREKKGHTSTTG
ncbi:sister-chromatid cohesion protein 3 [Ipomoea triloba]|uniref:sister-chromatid cohesion protein 3 n=1 Tax=Ipomoea triloba TaxID=35885 RepID=UPI00125DD5CF|nr:sister-chromatid cohesion protein 3 [Ipomoea triloba]